MFWTNLLVLTSPVSTRFICSCPGKSPYFLSLSAFVRSLPGFGLPDLQSGNLPTLRIITFWWAPPIWSLALGVEPGIRGGWHCDQPSAEIPVSPGYWKYIFTADSSMWSCWMWWSGALDSPRKSTLYTWGYSYSIHSCHIQKFSNDITIVGMTVSEGQPQMKGDVDQLQQETLQYGSREHLGTWKRAQSVTAPLGSFKVEGEIRARAKLSTITDNIFHHLHLPNTK